MCNEYVKPHREDMVEAMLGSDIIARLRDRAARAAAEGGAERG